MTHTLHRRGEREALEKDYVFVTKGAKKVNFPGTAERMRRFYEIARKHNPVFIGEAGRGNQLSLGLQLLLDGVSDKTLAHAVFRDLDTVTLVLQELLDAGFDRSVVISGLFDRVQECCKRVGLGVPHTIEYSAGAWGRTEMLPPKDYMEVTSMCGHDYVPAALVRHLVERVRTGKITVAEASLKMAHQCVCGVFNVARAAELVAALSAKDQAQRA